MLFRSNGTLVDSNGASFLKAYPPTLSLLDNYVIGSLSPQSATFTSLTVSNSVSLSPTTTSAINNMTIGAITPRTGAFTTLTASGTLTLPNTSTTHRISSTTVSTSTSTGALVVSGGLGIGDSVNIANNLSLNGIITQSTPPTSNSHLTNKKYVDVRSLVFSIALS